MKGGEEVKMSKRAGTYVTLRDLVDWVGRDAARYFLVSRKSDAEFVFDIDLAVKKSDENPVYYLQYAHARICSVLTQAEEKGFKVPTAQEAAACDLTLLDSPQAKALVAKMADYGNTLAVAARDLAPHLICVYLKELAATTTPTGFSWTMPRCVRRGWHFFWPHVRFCVTVLTCSGFPRPNTCKRNDTRCPQEQNQVSAGPRFSGPLPWASPRHWRWRRPFLCLSTTRPCPL